MKKMTTQLRERINSGRILIVPGCFNALTARLVEMTGFEVVYMTGYGVSFALAGLPDLGLTTMTEMVQAARTITSAINIPVIADCDTGYGNALNTYRAIQEYIRAGVAGIHIEDQVHPKRCGHMAGKRLIPVEEASGKIRAANAARNELDPDFLLIARTDARTAMGGSLEESIRRGQAYAEAGADMIFVEALLSLEELKKVQQNISLPLLYNCTLLSPMISFPQLEALGVSIVLFPGEIMRVCAKAVYDYLIRFKKDGLDAVQNLHDSMKDHPLADFHVFTGVSYFRQLEEQFLPPDDLERFSKSIGY